MKSIKFLYRDGANYKWNFTIGISEAKLKEIETKKGSPLFEESEVLYDEDLGISQEDFHEERGYKYDDEIDHNILEVMEIIDELPEGEPTTWTIQ
jgi:hypothetical protein